MRDAYFYKRPPIFGGLGPVGEIHGRLSPVAPQPVDNQLSALSEHPVQNRVIYSALDGKVDKVTGKGLSTNDYTDAEKTKLANIADGATRVIVDSAIDGTSANPVQNAAVKAALDTKVDKVWGKGLSANDYTTAEKIKLAGIDDGANKTMMDTALDYTSSNPLTNAAVCAALDNIIAAVDDVDDKTPPAGGAADQVLAKNSNTDYDYKWVTVGGGGGGAVNDVTVAGTSVLDGDTAKIPKASSSAWGAVKVSTLGEPPTLRLKVEANVIEGNAAVYVPRLNSNTQIPAGLLPDATTTAKGAMSAADKAKLDGLHGVPSGGTQGQVLKKASGTDYDVEWASESGGAVEDVTIGGTSIVSSGTAAIPDATSSVKGVVVVDSALNIVSTNPVRNSAVKSAIDSANLAISGKEPKCTEHTVSGTGAVTEELVPGDVYNFTGALTSLTITLGTPGQGVIAHYHFSFLSGSTAATLTMPSGVVMPSGFQVEANKRYEIDILNNYGTVMSWATS